MKQHSVMEGGGHGRADKRKEMFEQRNWKQLSDKQLSKLTPIERSRYMAVSQCNSIVPYTHTNHSPRLVLSCSDPPTLEKIDGRAGKGLGNEAISCRPPESTTAKSDQDPKLISRLLLHRCAVHCVTIQNVSTVLV